MEKHITPIFIFSLPRSGSTLLQRLLMSNSMIASVAEPWLLLPLLHLDKQGTTISEYSHLHSTYSINDFISNLKGGRREYLKQLRTFVTSLYSSFCNENEIYFLDKTPRYYFIINEIAELFPDAKYIFLTRGPNQVYSSIVKTLCNNRLINLCGYDIDLKVGPQSLYSGYQQLKNKSYLVSYEDLVRHPSNTMKTIFEYLELDFNPRQLDNYSSIKFAGRKGDPKTYEFDSVVSHSLHGWQKTISNPIRKKLLESYVKSKAAAPFYSLGYDKNETLYQIRNLKVDSKYIIKDSFEIFLTNQVVKFKLNQFFSKSLNWNKNFMS